MKYHLLFTAICCAVLLSCKMVTALSPRCAYDLVCGMKVGRSQSHTHVYQGNTYYFDTYACKQAFSRKPEKFISNPGAGTSKKYVRAKF